MPRTNGEKCARRQAWGEGRGVRGCRRARIEADPTHLCLPPRGQLWNYNVLHGRKGSNKPGDLGGGASSINYFHPSSPFRLSSYHISKDGRCAIRKRRAPSPSKVVRCKFHSLKATQCIPLVFPQQRANVRVVIVALRMIRASLSRPQVPARPNVMSHPKPIRGARPARSAWHARIMLTISSRFSGR
jgi:hypothetical protein